jgi:tetratricopeptide (TPR) repeat protein
MTKFVAVVFFVSFFAFSLVAQTPTAEDHFADGVRLIQDEKFDAALSAFEKSAALDDKRPETQQNIGSIYLILKKYERAETAFRAAIKIDPNNGNHHTQLCIALSKQEKHDDAIKACAEGVRLDPESDRARGAQFTAMQMAGRKTAELQELIDRAVAQFRASELLLNLAADFYLRDRNFSYAANLLETLISMRPNASAYHGMLAEVYLRLGRDAESLASARTALRLEPTNPYANFAMGLIFFELGQHEESAESFGKVQTDNLRLNYAGYYLAVSRSRSGRKTEAVSTLKELVQKYPDNIDFQKQLATDLSALHRYDEAEIAYSRANQLKPDTPEIIAGLGMSHMMRGQFDQAIQYFDESLKLSPGNEFYKMFGEVSRGRRNLIPQIPSMIKAVDDEPKDLKKRFDLTRVLLLANRVAEAERHIQEIYLLDPQDPRVYQSLGVGLSEAGLTEKAADAYRRSLAKRETPDAYLGLAGIYAERGEFESASAAYSKVIELKPDTPNIMKAYGDLLRENGKRREAVEMYKRSLAILPNNGPAIFQAGLLSLKLGDRDGALIYLERLKGIDPQSAAILSRCIALRIWG